jgi:TPR repeat protein
MRTCSRIGVAASWGLALAGQAWAFDPDTPPREAFRSGYNAYKQGDTASAVEALNFAAEKGFPAALWKLARMYASGDGVEEDDVKAFEIYYRIANEHADGDPRASDARFVADAFVELGAYYRTGIPGGVPADDSRARRFFSYAASYFGDPEAQFRLGEMYLEGLGGERNERQAARWFKLAAEKGHAGAQAQLGRLLVQGIGLARNIPRGLMWLSIALQTKKDDPSLQTLHDEAFAAASETERQAAVALAETWLASKRASN